MGMKTIMIKDTIYRRLEKIKGKMSFSELFDSMLNERRAEKLAALRKIKGILTDREAMTAYKRIREIEMYALVEA